MPSLRTWAFRKMLDLTFCVQGPARYTYKNISRHYSPGTYDIEARHPIQVSENLNPNLFPNKSLPLPRYIISPCVSYIARSLPAKSVQLTPFASQTSCSFSRTLGNTGTFEARTAALFASSPLCTASPTQSVFPTSPSTKKIVYTTSAGFEPARANPMPDYRNAISLREG
jgi:hypothetical protein